MAQRRDICCRLTLTRHETSLHLGVYNAGPLHGKCALLSLRTCKADVVVGLEEGVAERLDASSDESERRWRINGKWVSPMSSGFSIMLNILRSQIRGDQLQWAVEIVLDGRRNHLSEM